MNISTNPTMSTVCWPVIKICEFLGRNNPELLVKLRYWGKFRKFPNLKAPQNLNEKILWLKLYSDISQWIILADKYKVRFYLEKIGLGRYLVPLIGKWDSEKDIDFSALPNSLIFKVNNGDGKGTNLIVKDLANENKDKLRAVFHKWLNRKNIGDLSAEPQYKDIPPCIIAEQLLQIPEGARSIIDYKIWCINGKARYVRAYSDRHKDGGGANVMTYDLNWNAHPEFAISTSEFQIGEMLPKPKNFEEMITVAETLANGFPIIRVDLYNINGKIYFGEMTFTSQGGMMNNLTDEFLTMLGNEADISHIKKVRNI